MERGPFGGAGLTGSPAADMNRLLDALGVAVPVRHAVSTVVRGTPTPIQVAALADATAGSDLLAVAPTGSGKTLVFAIAIAHRLAGSPSTTGRPRALVVAPTRELADQNAEIIAHVGAGAGLKVATFVGGQPLARDRRSLVAPVDVAVGTPGRLADLARTGGFTLAGVELIVLDEADQLLGPSFDRQTRALLAGCGDAPLVATTATADTDMEEQLRTLRHELVVHRVEPGSDSASRGTGPEQPGSAPVATELAGSGRAGSGQPGKAAATGSTGAPRRVVILTSRAPERTAAEVAARCRRGLFFVARRDSVTPLQEAISASGVTVGGVAGSASPTRRATAFADLAAGRIRVLVSTDLAGRGLDISDIGHIVHVGPPHSVDDLVHRSGRTGRGAGHVGVVAAVLRPSDVERVADQARSVGMTVVVVDTAHAGAARRLDELLGPEITPPAIRRAPAPAEKSRRPPPPRRPARSRVHRPKRGKRS